VYDIDSYSRSMLPPHEISVSSGKWGLILKDTEDRAVFKGRASEAASITSDKLRRI